MTLQQNAAIEPNVSKCDSSANQKYIMYYNADKKWPSHNHRGNTYRKFGEVRTCGF